MKTSIVVTSVCATLLLSGCAGMSDTEQRAVSGAAIGAAGGAVIGAISGKAALGAAIGAGTGLVGGLVVDKVEKDTDRNFWMSADEAKGYGLVHQIVETTDKVK